MSSNGSFLGVPLQMGLPSNPIFMALAEQYSVSELNLKQCKMEPSSSGANNDNSLKISHEEQWNMGRTRHDHQQQNPSTFFSIRRHVLNSLLGMVSAPDGQIVRTIAREVNAISVLIQKYANLLLNCHVSFQRRVLKRSQDLY